MHWSLGSTNPSFNSLLHLLSHEYLKMQQSVRHNFLFQKIWNDTSFGWCEQGNWKHAGVLAKKHPIGNRCFRNNCPHKEIKKRWEAKLTRSQPHRPPWSSLVTCLWTCEICNFLGRDHCVTLLENTLSKELQRTERQNGILLYGFPWTHDRWN